MSDLTREQIERIRNENDALEDVCDMALAKKSAKKRAERAEAECERLEAALRALVDEYCEYMRINNLGDPEKQHNIRRARVALATAPADEWPDRFYEAVGWTLAECCAALNRGEDPRHMEAPALLERCKRDLSRDAAAPTDGRV